MAIAYPSSPPLPKSRVKAFPFNYWEAHHGSVHLFLFLCFFIFNISTTLSLPSSSSSILYKEHCNAIVPESSPTGAKPAFTDQFLRLENAYFEGGKPIFDEAPRLRRSLSLQTTGLYQTLADGVIKVEAKLIIRNEITSPIFRNWPHRRRLRMRYVPPRFPLHKGLVSFGLHGFWSSSSGKLCMVGYGSNYAKDGKLRHFSTVLKLNYQNSSSIASSLVSGTLESLDVVGSWNYFEPVSVLGLSLMNYEYTLVDTENENGGFNGCDGNENASLSLKSDSNLCLLFRSGFNFELEYVSDCSSVTCNPLGGTSDILPSFMSLNGIHCLDKLRLRALFGFSSYGYKAYNQPFDPNTTLVAEGAWDEKKNRLCLIACRVFNSADSLIEASLGDCSIKLCFRFPTTLSIRNRSPLLGEIWSNRTMDDMGYFGRIVIRKSGHKRQRLSGVKYEYTEIDNARAFCAEKKPDKSKKMMYANGYNFDTRFYMSIKNSKGQKTSGSLVLLAMDDQIYDHYTQLRHIESAITNTTSHSGLRNVSYTMSIKSSQGFHLANGINSTKFVDISAEGVYDTETGDLCMIGCRRLGSYSKQSTESNSVDCEIHVSIQYTPLKARGRIRSLKGIIQSTRGKSDPLYFEPLGLSSSSISANQAAESIFRMDLEIVMVLISDTLACVFLGLQLFYVKRHPDVLPFISIVMLIVLTLGHMIPLVLNFEAFFLPKHNHQTSFLGSGGWVEVNEVIVRVVTLIAFLLQFRLLQLTWTSRGGDGSQEGLWISEKKVLYLSLPFYVGGGLIAWFIHRWKSAYQSPLLLARGTSYHPYSLLGVLRSYAGLLLDGFLLPQIMFNLFFNSVDKALAPSFYIGISVVRLLPHAYDLYRTHRSSWSFDLLYIYANPKMDLYSTSWDVIIPCFGLLFVVLIYLQQRFGGRSILPNRFKKNSVYEKVPVVNGE